MPRSTKGLTRCCRRWRVCSISGVAAPTQGRFAFRYYVNDGGPSGNNSNYIGVDLFVYGEVPVELQSISIE